MEKPRDFCSRQYAKIVALNRDQASTSGHGLIDRISARMAAAEYARATIARSLLLYGL